MRNGDRLTCEVKSLNSDTLSISLDYAAGTISIDWSKVDHIESKQLFLVKTQDGLVYSGSLSTPSTPGARPTKIEVLEESTSKVELDKTHVIHMEETDLSFLRRFNGEVGLSSIYNKGNQSAQYNLNADAVYPRERWSAAVSYSSSFSSSTGSSSVTRNESQNYGAAPFALEQLVLRRPRRLSAEFRAGYPAPVHFRRRDRSLLQKHQQHENKRL